MENGHALIGRQSICSYLGIGKNLFYKLVTEGLPVRKLGSIWISHTRSMDRFFDVDACGALRQGQKEV